VKAFTKREDVNDELLVIDGVHTRRPPPTATQKEYAAMDWRHRSACLDEDPELFFPIGNTGPAILQIEEAKQVCRRCDVREQCLAWALEAGQDHGVWGGMSEDERRALKRRNARAKVRTA
jgi:WhiB family redox-sensing transcriptional regulator